MYYAALLALFLFSSCTGTSKKNAGSDSENCTLISLGVNEVTDLNLLLDDLEFIPLQANEDGFFQEVTQIIVADTLLYILDIRSNRIVVFDTQGHYCKKIDCVGQGPGEYSLAFSFSINEKDRRLYLLDADNKIISYDLDSFSFIEEKKISAGVSYEPLEGGGFVSFSFLPGVVDSKTYNSHLLIWDEKLNVQFEAIPIQFESGYIMGPPHRFYRYNNDVYAFPPFENIIYKVDQNACVPHYKIDYGKYKQAPLDFLTKKDNENYIRRLYGSDFVRHFTPFETDSYFAMKYSVKENKYISFFNKATGESFYVSSPAKESANNCLFNICTTIGDQFVSFANMDELSNHSFLSDNLNYQQLLSDNMDFDSSVLVLLKFK